MVVAPCFDKKLEAVREEFYNSMLETRDVDCVLTSGKIFKKTIFATILEFVRPLSLVSAEHIYCLEVYLKPEDCLCSGKAELISLKGFLQESRQVPLNSYNVLQKGHNGYSNIITVIMPAGC